MMARLLLLAGWVCLAVVVLTHAAEGMHWLPSMGWGLPNSPGHYLDLFSGIVGVACLLAAAVWLLQSKVRHRPAVDQPGKPGES